MKPLSTAAPAPISKKLQQQKTMKEEENLKNLLEELTFEQTVNFLQEKIRQSFLDLEEDRRGKEKKD
jgi:hypothetical protein